MSWVVGRKSGFETKKNNKSAKAGQQAIGAAASLGLYRVRPAPLAAAVVLLCLARLSFVKADAAIYAAGCLCGLVASRVHMGGDYGRR